MTRRKAMAVPWWLMPGAMFGISAMIKSKAGAGKFRWIAMPELDVRGMSVLVAAMKAESGNALPAPPAGQQWKPLQLTFQPGPLSAPAIIVIHALEPVVAQAASQGTAGFLTLQHLQGLAGPPRPHPRPHRPHGGGWRGPTVIYDGGFYPYVAPLYAEDISTVIPTETWTVEWMAGGKKQKQFFRTELEARRLMESLAAGGAKPTLTRGGVI